MVTASATREGASSRYVVHLSGSPPDTLVARFAPSGVRQSPPQTALRHTVASQDELATLLDRVLSLGLVLEEVHEFRVAPRRTAHRVYEVRVAGWLEEPTLRVLRWQHRHLPQRAAVSLEGSPEHVHEFLSACCSLGLGIERVRAVAPAG